MRIAGSGLLAAICLNLGLIQILRRRDGDVIWRYIAESRTIERLERQARDHGCQQGFIVVFFVVYVGETETEGAIVAATRTWCRVCPGQTND